MTDSKDTEKTQLQAALNELKKLLTQTPPPAEPAPADYKKITVHGMPLLVDVNAFDDLAFFEQITALQKGEDLAGFTDMFETLLGSQQYSILKAVIERRNGRISISYMSELMTEIMQQAAPKS